MMKPNTPYGACYKVTHSYAKEEPALLEHNRKCMDRTVRENLPRILAANPDAEDILVEVRLTPRYKDEVPV